METVQLDYFKDKTTESLSINQNCLGGGEEKNGVWEYWEMMNWLESEFADKGIFANVVLHMGWDFNKIMFPPKTTIETQREIDATN